ncbi:hypothetical protein Lesp02_82910 [Lentzea sp. NBRC 105346]|uniref:hypothetical protein n=1 Tax=Lentzea sp. NBRC 105346 TaxID=3032205 RepID=UPI0024A4A4EF|nr:hypothetical protein [Lentzea sp. NBRC 105346]GLZ36104.1 hypothetical protein Lesp02_82910 [Lentzea sp. NBRC 105346]
MVEDIRIPVTRQYWYVASCMDGDAHLAASINAGIVTPLCGGRSFRPFTALARPADPEQGCPRCVAVRARGG